MSQLDSIFRQCKSIIGDRVWIEQFGNKLLSIAPEQVPEMLAKIASKQIPGYLSELGRLELDLYMIRQTYFKVPDGIEQVTLNPTLRLRQCTWKNLVPFLIGNGNTLSPNPQMGSEIVMMWKDPENADVSIEVPSKQSLLALKLVAEENEITEIAKEENVPPVVLKDAIDLAVNRGILLAPESLIRKDVKTLAINPEIPDSYLRASVFTLQWHVTQVCDLQCRHCYDRKNRPPLTLADGFKVLSNLDKFCKKRHVRGQVSFTGGNPLLYPDLTKLYRAASHRGFSISILGNPTDRRRIEDLIAIQMPVFFQVSLEGLPEHNDTIRGNGNFDRTIQFLKILNELEVPSKVMLTLTKDNLNQVLPLSDMLEGITTDFTFNRLSRIGSGADLALPSPDEFAAFLEEYITAAKNKPMLRLKDNLLNILLHNSGGPLFGGCTGYGCGAAFCFLTVLSDGEVHACRKFPSRIGNLLNQTLDDIYDSDIAERYRNGAWECRECRIRPVCGGCMATTYSCGLDPFKRRDPYCFNKTP